MHDSPPVRPGAPDPVALHSYALEHLRYIRHTMERAASFTAVSGRAQVVVGLVGLTAALVAWRQPTRTAWLATWLASAVLSAAVSVAGFWKKGKALGVPLFSGPGRKFALSFLPSLFAGVVVTAILVRAGHYDLLPTVWLLLFGSAVMAGGSFSVPPVPVMGACFLVLGVVAALSPAEWGNALMALGFGLVNLVFGTLITVKYGG